MAEGVEEREGGLGADVLTLGALLTGLVGAVVGLFSPALVYEIPFVLGLVALVLGIIAWLRVGRGTRKRMAIGGTLLGALALACGVWGAVQVESALGDLGAGLGPDEEFEKGEEFCNSDTGDQLDRAGSGTTDSASQLERRTDRVLRLAADAPPGAFCAVSALDSVASSWNLYASDPGYQDAERQVRRIRRFQRENDLREF